MAKVSGVSSASFPIFRCTCTAISKFKYAAGAVDPLLRAVGYRALLSIRVAHIMERWTMEDDDPDYVPSVDEDEEEDEDAEEDMDEEEQEHDLNVDLNIDEVDLDGSPAQDLLHTLVELHRLADQSGTQGARPSDATQLLVRLLGDEPLRLTRMPVSNVAAAPRAQVSDEEDEDEESDEVFDGYGLRGGTGSRHLPAWAGPTTEPQEAGMKLLMGGEFGHVRNKINGPNVAKTLASRATKSRKFYREDVLSNLVPNTNGTAVASYDSNIYCGQFSADSTFYYTCAQDFRLHIYDVTAPPQRTRPIHETRYRRMRSDHETTMKVMKTISGHAGRWTITDSHLSPDNERIIYSSITPVVWMATTLDSSTTQKPINFSDRPIRDSDWDYDRFGIWSCRFSADGNEVIAGGNRRIFVYDLLADRRTVKIHAHDNDINSCCWADTASGNILISASDDTFIKVWDRRSLGSSPKPSGVLIGHTEGITNVSAKGDGRYIISNGKDQALRLWDLRKMRTNEEYESVKHASYGSPNFDYRYGSFPRLTRPAHPKDCSIMTYRGHTVLQTLIRCHFSPAETTGGQYIYSGSADGRVHIWSLDGRIVQVLDRKHTLPMSFDPSGPEPGTLGGLRRDAVCVRDVSWSSREPAILSAGWENGRNGSVVARHEWKGLQKMPGALEDWVQKAREERDERARVRSARMPGAFGEEEDEL